MYNIPIIIIAIISIVIVFRKIAFIKTSEENKNILLRKLVIFSCGKKISICNVIIMILVSVVTIMFATSSIKTLFHSIYIFMALIFGEFVSSKNVYSYLTLTTILFLVSYYPEKVLVLLKKLKLTPNLLIFFICIFITALSLANKIMGLGILSFETYNSIKSIIIKSVVTNAVIYSLINLFKCGKQPAETNIKQIENK